MERRSAEFVAVKHLRAMFVRPLLLQNRGEAPRGVYPAAAIQTGPQCNPVFRMGPRRFSASNVEANHVSEPEILRPSRGWRSPHRRM